jgi:hypothetical protein
MPYTVVRESTNPPAAVEDDDTRLIGTQLLKQGVPLDRVPRVRPERGVNGWLYAWESREEAESAAAQLERRTRDRWVVRQTDAEPSLGPLRWLQIDAVRESDGWVFALDLITRKMIQQRFPGSCRHRRVLVAVEAEDDLPADAPHFLDLARRVLYLLTWVPADELAVFGEFQIFDPAERRILLPATHIIEGSGFSA